jgi:hypothetical protein
MNRSCKAFLCQNELGLITVTMNVEGDNVFYDLLKYIKGQLHTVLRKCPVFLVVLNSFCKESLQ